LESIEAKVCSEAFFIYNNRRNVLTFCRLSQAICKKFIKYFLVFIRGLRGLVKKTALINPMQQSLKEKNPEILKTLLRKLYHLHVIINLGCKVRSGDVLSESFSGGQIVPTK
jgi:hypothetical protein